MKFTAAVAVVWGGLLFGVAPVRAQDPASTYLRFTLDAGVLPVAGYPDFRAVRPFLDSVYRRRGDAPIWDLRDGFGEIAHAAIVALRGSAERGLLPGDYDVKLLDSIATAGPDPDPVHRAQRDLLLTIAVTRYLRDLRDGRTLITPFVHLKTGVPIPADVALLTRAAAGVPIETLAREVEPHLAQYRNLLFQLAKYRALANTLRYHRLPATSARRGQRYAGAAELRRRLIAFGDLPAEAAQGPRDRYDSLLAEGIRHFQLRHALHPDGVLGAATRAALNVTPASRARQLALALERLRWLPPLDGPRLLVVNIPAFDLFAFDSIGGTGEPLFEMPVVIGSAYDHRTPVMLQPLTRVEFHPYWNVPPTIVRAEILPALAQDAGYLRKLHMEVVGVRDTVLGDSVTPEITTLLAQGRLRVRQRPGPWNALGLTKFTFPNQEDVYLHGTPDTTLFRRARRDLSHGCIRVQRPPLVAEWALKGGTWDRARIDSVLAGTIDTVWAPVVLPTSVLIFYTTAVAMPDGEARFYQDIYGHDHELAVDLRERHKRFRPAADTPLPAP